jgi:transcriptional regulator of arginine metabolism
MAAEPGSSAHGRRAQRARRRAVAGAATPPTAPQTKIARQAAVADILIARPVRSQRELSRALADRDIAVTQATLSRDLDELGATKVRRADGRLAYVVPAANGSAPAQPSATASERLARRCGQLLVDADGTAHLAVLHTPPGGAHLLASALDAAGRTDTLGCVAGDDTVVVVCRRPGGGARLARELRALTQAAPRVHRAGGDPDVAHHNGDATANERSTLS